VLLTVTHLPLRRACRSSPSTARIRAARWGPEEAGKPGAGSADAAVVIDVLRANKTNNRLGPSERCRSRSRPSPICRRWRRQLLAWPAEKAAGRRRRGGTRFQGLNLGNSPWLHAGVGGWANGFFLSTTMARAPLDRVTACPCC